VRSEAGSVESTYRGAVYVKVALVAVKDITAKVRGTDGGPDDINILYETVDIFVLGLILAYQPVNVLLVDVDSVVSCVL